MFQDFAGAAAYIREHGRGHQTAKVDGAVGTTVGVEGDGSIAVRYHHTPVVRYHANGDIVLDNGGYMTPTTKRRLNDFSPFRVYAERGAWFFHANGIKYHFTRGVWIDADGEVQNGMRAD